MNQPDSLIGNSPDANLPVWFRLDLLQKDTTHALVLSDSLSGKKGDSDSPPGFFSGHSIKPLARKPIDRITPDQDWLFGSFAIVLVFIVLLRLTWPRHINLLLRSVLFPSKENTEGRIFEFRFDSFSLVFMLIYGMTYSVLLVSLLSDFHWMPALQPQQSALLFFAFTFAFIVLIGAKWFLAAVSAAIFGVKQQGLFYRDHLLLSGFVSAALIIPLVVINAFSSSVVFLYIALAIVLISETLRVIRSFVAAIGMHDFSIVHIFLYFCTLETVPLLIIGKIIMIFQVI